MAKIRSTWWVLFFLVLGALCVGFYVERVEGLLPCTLCVLQRMAYMGVGLTAFFGAIWPYRTSGFRFFALLGLLFSVCGVALSGRQVWLQHQITDPNAPCVPGLSYLFQAFPFGKALEIALRGTTDCGQVSWMFWSLSMAEWSLICFSCVSFILWVLLFCSTPRVRLFR